MWGCGCTSPGCRKENGGVHGTRRSTRYTLVRACEPATVARDKRSGGCCATAAAKGNTALSSTHPRILVRERFPWKADGWWQEVQPQAAHSGAPDVTHGEQGQGN